MQGDKQWLQRYPNSLSLSLVIYAEAANEAMAPKTKACEKSQAFVRSSLVSKNRPALPAILPQLSRSKAGAFF
jgi:hypothetical protein